MTTPAQRARDIFLDAVEIAARLMQLRFDVTLRRERLAAVARAQGPFGPIIDDRCPGSIIGHRDYLDHCNRARLEPVNANAIVGLDGKHELSAEVR